MADISKKVDKILEMVSNGDYFNINRPRQFGKTTVMYLLEQRLKKDKGYLVPDISFNGNGFDFKEVQVSEEKRLDIGACLAP